MILVFTVQGDFLLQQNLYLGLLSTKAKYTLYQLSIDWIKISNQPYLYGFSAKYFFIQFMNTSETQEQLILTDRLPERQTH